VDLKGESEEGMDTGRGAPDVGSVSTTRVTQGKRASLDTLHGGIAFLVGRGAFVSGYAAVSAEMVDSVIRLGGAAFGPGSVEDIR
jgi:hypothetical protein